MDQPAGDVKHYSRRLDYDFYQAGRSVRTLARWRLTIG
jgi:hypothetical protein